RRMLHVEDVGSHKNSSSVNPSQARSRVKFSMRYMSSRKASARLLTTATNLRLRRDLDLIDRRRDGEVAAPSTKRSNNDEAIGRLEKTVVDCPDPRALAEFYAAVLGMQIN